MIQSFACGETRKIFEGFVSRKLPPNLQRVAHCKLLQLHIAQNLSDLRIPPANRLEAWPGDHLGQHSIRINQQWLAKRLHVPSTRLHAILKGQRAISPDTALRLERFFGLTDGYFLRWQTEYDLRLAKRELAPRIEAEVTPLVPLSA